MVLDSYAVLALLKDEPPAAEVQRLVEGEEEAALTTLGVDEAVLDLAQLGLADPPATEIGLAVRAGLLRARHYHRKNRVVSLADCVAAETARPRDFRLASADPHLLDMCRNEGIAVIPLPDSTGRIWPP
jgi:predicted nucleic acid-binding protein